MGRKPSDEALRCSFCHKSQDVAAKLISSPNDNPRAFICDECVEVCNAILEDDKPKLPWVQRRRAHELVEEVPPEKLDTLIERIGELLENRAD